MKKTLFCFFYYDLREYEWFEPYIKQLVGKVELSAIFPMRPQTNRQIYVKSQLLALGVSVSIASQLLWMGRSHIAKLNLKLPFLFRALYNPESSVHRSLPVFRGLFLRNSIRFISDYDILFFTNGRGSKEQSGTYTEFVLQAARESRIPFITVPFSGVEILREVPGANHLVRYDLMESQKHYSPTKSINVGALRFRKRLARDERNSVRAEYVIFALKNRSSWMSELVSKKAHKRLRVKIIDQLLQRGFRVQVKPHPGIPEHELKDLKEMYPSEKVSFSSLSLETLSGNAVAAVFEFASSGMFEVLSVGVPVYWPIEELASVSESISSHGLIHQLVVDGLPDAYFTLSRNCYPAKFQIPAVYPEEIEPLNRIVGDSVGNRVDISEALKEFGVI